MKTAAVVIDKWKLQIFKRHLEAAGYEFTEKPGLTEDSLLLSVEYELVAPLARIIDAAQLECASQ